MVLCEMASSPLLEYSTGVEYPSYPNLYFISFWSWSSLLYLIHTSHDGWILVHLWYGHRLVSFRFVLFHAGRLSISLLGFFLLHG